MVLLPPKTSVEFKRPYYSAQAIKAAETAIDNVALVNNVTRLAAIRMLQDYLIKEEEPALKMEQSGHLRYMPRGFE